MLTQDEKEALVSLRDSAAWPALQKLNSMLVQNFGWYTCKCPIEEISAARQRYEGAKALVNAVEENIEKIGKQESENRPSVKRARK